MKDVIYVLIIDVFKTWNFILNVGNNEEVKAIIINNSNNYFILYFKI